MIENIRNSGSRLDQPLPDGAQPVGRSTKATASGISSLQGAVPPSITSASRSTTATFAPASAVPPAEYDGAVGAAASRFSAAADALNPASVPDGDAGLALSPRDAARALFKAALQSNEHQQDDALQKRKEAMEVARSQQLAQAASNRAAAKDIKSNAANAFYATLGSCAASLATIKWDTGSTRTILDVSSKGLDGFAKKYEATASAATKTHEADGSLAASNAELANTHKADANDLTERLRQQFQQLFQALSEMRAEKANQLRALV
ncbi:hypothetical protein XH83_13075 [Bradyrhizobium sp. CCBAU 53351]|uniref:hypothetical protein n=1 Tax=Bradyrhizobium sp. CCBAU 53351 TaxID=1325114 RepID=UPI001886F3B7|nr:hypothetical protein [Bradyrhizobium sp. CCBAU 53351]QOZ76294.1 hypothetical protein XH83_13075 [Bradyrhizobium sp. CCBAU 53351]